MGVIFLAFFAMYLPQPFTPNYLSNQGGYDLSQIGILFSVSSAGVVVLNLVLGALPALTGFLVAQFAVVLFALILWRSTGFAWYVVGFFMLGGYRTARNLGVAQVRQLVPSAKMGLGYGVTETVAGTVCHPCTHFGWCSLYSESGNNVCHRIWFDLGLYFY